MHPAELNTRHSGSGRTGRSASKSAIVFVLDLDGNIEYANHAAQELCDHLVGPGTLRNISEIAGDSAEVLSHIRTVFFSGEHHSVVRCLEFFKTGDAPTTPMPLFEVQSFRVRGRRAVGYLLLPLRPPEFAAANEESFVEPAGEAVPGMAGAS